MRRIFILLLTILPSTVVADNRNDSIDTKRFAVGINIGQPKRLYGGDYAPDEGPYYFFSGQDNHHSYSVG